MLIVIYCIDSANLALGARKVHVNLNTLQRLIWVVDTMLMRLT